MKIAWFDCFAGISGDMTLGALIGAGWDRSALETLPARLGLEGVSVTSGSVRRGPFSATGLIGCQEGETQHEGGNDR